MTLAMLIAGLLFGVALTVTLGLFVVMSMDGGFRENLRAAAAECRNFLTGRRKRARAVVPARNVEFEARLRAAQEEVRVMQRLMGDARSEREAHEEAMRRSSDELAALRRLVAEREDRIREQDGALFKSTAVVDKLRTELAERGAELARVLRQVKDLETELGVARSATGLGAFSEEIARLARERDELNARLNKLAQQRPATAAAIAPLARVSD
jgi:chromosome segregation ATPase